MGRLQSRVASGLLLATNNRGKVREYCTLLEGLPYNLVTPEEMGITETVEEAGKTLEENARIKALFYASRSRLLTLADDSGLEVDALGGEPGPLSARYAGESATDKDRVSYLLSRLQGVPWEKRTARFRCVIAIARPGGEVRLYEGERRGIISFEPRGEMGFGYDPVFYLPEFDKTMAELPLEVKNQVSHRGEAARKVRQALAEIAPFLPIDSTQ